MGVAVDELFAHPVGHAVQVKDALLLLHPGVERHLEKHVAQLLLQVLGAALVNGLHSLVDLLEEVPPDALMGLLRVPGAAAGGAENPHNFHQIVHIIGILVLKIYHTLYTPASGF